MKKVRLTLDLSEKLNLQLEDLCRRSGGWTKSEFLRRAIALMEVSIEGKERHEDLALIDSNGNITTRIVGI